MRASSDEREPKQRNLKRLVAAKHTRFIVLMLTDRDNYGFDEHTLPPLVTLMESASPDGCRWLHTGVIGYFLTSSRSVSRVQHVIEQAEGLRTADERFASLGVGLAEGPMVADFTWLGRLKPKTFPLGTVANDASHSAQLPDAYRQPLQSLLNEFDRNA